MTDFAYSQASDDISKIPKFLFGFRFVDAQSNQLVESDKLSIFAEIEHF